ncbi:hypothetical protein HYV86_01500 [Candidatus Woesearchaeota archaeon]|nr:hypothetical protein [Candidatus Woesearchaeota archaeon]
MKDNEYDSENDDLQDEEVSVEEDEISSQEDGFMRGYNDEEVSKECAECGAAVQEEKAILKEIEGENYTFCSRTCAQDFEDSMK